MILNLASKPTAIARFLVKIKPRAPGAGSPPLLVQAEPAAVGDLKTPLPCLWL